MVWWIGIYILLKFMGVEFPTLDLSILERFIKDLRGLLG